VFTVGLWEVWVWYSDWGWVVVAVCFWCRYIGREGDVRSPGPLGRHDQASKHQGEEEGTQKDFVCFVLDSTS